MRSHACQDVEGPLQSKQHGKLSKVWPKKRGPYYNGDPKKVAISLAIYHKALLSKIGGPQCGPQNSTILSMGTPIKVPLILGRLYMALAALLCFRVVFALACGLPGTARVEGN